MTPYRQRKRIRAGTDAGDNYDPTNRQYFGFASYDTDQETGWFTVPALVTDEFTFAVDVTVNSKTQRNVTATNAILGPVLADAGGPYLVTAGDSVTLDALASFALDQSAETLTYTWDLDGDAIFGETRTDATRGDEVGMSPTFSSVGLTAPASTTIRLRVTDAGLLTHTDTATVFVTTSLYWNPDSDATNNNLTTGAGLGGSGQWMAAGSWYNPTTDTHTTWDNAAYQTAPC